MLTVAADEPVSIMDENPTTTPTTSARLILLFKAGLALGIPPEAALPAPWSTRPMVLSEPHELLRPADVQAVLGCRTRDVGRGRVAAGELDRRLRGLVLSLSVCRVVDGPGALISMGVVWPDPTATRQGGATAGDHWAIVKEAAERPGATSEHLHGFGDDAFLWLHGGRTAVLAWLERESVATVSVTSPPANRAWATSAARAIAVVAAERLDVDKTRT